MCESLRQYSHQRRLVDKIKDDELNSFYDKHKFEANDIVKNPTALIASTECSNHIEQSIEASQTSFNTNNQDSHLDKRFALDWDGGDFPSLYANTQSLFSAVQVDPGLPAPIIPTDSIGHIEPKDLFCVSKGKLPRSSSLGASCGNALGRLVCSRTHRGGPSSAAGALPLAPLLHPAASTRPASLPRCSSASLCGS
jgi:hypothetical protein